MEALIELVFEIIFEIFVEIILHFVTKIFSSLFHIYENNSKTKKVIKHTLVYIFFALVLSLLIFSLFTKKGLYIRVVLIYFIISLFVYLFKFFNKNIFKSKFNVLLRIITSLLHYALAISLIVVTAISEITNSSVIVIVFSSIAIIIFLMLDIFRIRARKNKKAQNQKQMEGDVPFKTEVLDKLL
ncbi:MAG TPA: hypothetical protein GXZ48_07880 [Acholeplasmataceae bacterium]|nr:hypothetical protein [Acholeplasmataceae bacterium]